MGIYGKGYIVNYIEGDRSLERNTYRYNPGIGDKAHIVIEGQNLEYISFLYYKTPLYWFLIADVNEVDNPFYLEPGQNIIIPDLNNYKL